GQGFKGYTTASNQALLGAAIIETPVISFALRDALDEQPFTNLHGATVDVTISPNLFVMNGGIATIKMIIKRNDAASPHEITFFSDECKGASAALGDIHFVATLVELPSNEWDAPSLTYVPF